MNKAKVIWTDLDGEHSAELSLLDWVAWEKHTGKSAGKGIDQITDLLYLSWHAAKRDGEKRPFDGWVARLEDLPTLTIDEQQDPTQPGV
jgi:hypothetical protein